MSNTAAPTHRKVLSVFSLVMINVIAVDSLRSLSINAQLGASLIFYYVLAALLFFFPIAFVAAELATGWPQTGGIYIWVREAFGKRWGFVTIWLQWFYNIVWYPTILAFVATTLAYLFNPALAHSKTYLISVLLGSFWITTLINCGGIQLSSWISTAGAIIGTLLPITFLIILAAVWLLLGHPSQIDFHWHSFLPTNHTSGDLAFLVAVLFGLLGMEMSATHAENVRHPKRDYPKAIAYSALIILLSLALSSLAIAIVLPKQQLDLVSGLIDAFVAFLTPFHLQALTPWLILMIILGAFCSVSTWVIGPVRGLMIAIEDECLPAWLSYTNKKEAPVTLLLLQAVIFSLISLTFVYMPTIQSSYWVLSALAAQLAMIVYVFMFAAAIHLRYKYPLHYRTYNVPGGTTGMWILAGIGTLTCLATIVLGLLPPTGIDIGNVWSYPFKLLGGIVLCMLIPLALFQEACLSNPAENIK
jgi:amino acid transporter